MKVNHIRQNVFPVLAALIWGTAFVAQSVAADHVGPFTFTAARSAVAFVFLLVLCLVFRCLRRRDFQEEAQARPGSWRDLAIGGICCGVVLTMGTNLQQMGLETTTSGKAGFITALYIVIVPIAGIFLRQKAPRAIWLSVALAVVGLYLLCVQESFSITEGDWYVLLCAYIGYFLHAVIVYSATVKALGGVSPLAFFKGMFPAMAMAFSSASSVGTLPLNLECTERLGARRDIASFVLPLGATINMDGTAIYQGVCAVFIATCYGVDLTLGQMITIVLTATLASIGTAGVPGSGVVMLTMVLESVNLPVAGIGLVIGVDRIFDMGRTTVNITGDAACALVVSNLEKKAEARRAARRPRA